MPKFVVVTNASGKGVLEHVLESETMQEAISRVEREFDDPVVEAAVAVDGAELTLR